MTTVSTNAELMSALAVAVGGDRIELAGGDYGSIDIRGLTFPSDVTIVSADPANPAIFGELYVKDVSHLVFDGILFDYVYVDGDVGWVKPFSVYNSAFITIRNSVFDGAEVPSGSVGGEYGTGYGLWAQSSDNVVVENNEFFNFYKAFVVLFGSSITVNANEFRTCSGDMINFISVDGVLIEGNWLHSIKIDPDSGNHTDMIQLWTSPGDLSVRNVVIRGNFIDAGTGDWSQSIYMANDPTDEPFQNILIEDNVVYNDHSHGITVGFINGLVIRKNTLLHDPHTAILLGWPPRINLDEASLDVTVEDNITGDVWNWEAMTNQPGWTVGNNLLLEYDSASPDYYAPLFVDPLALNATLADLRAVAGGVIEQTDVGAAMTRADIPMVVGPYATAPSPDPVPEPDVCEALLADALAVVADLEAQLAIMTIARDTAQSERDVALALQAVAEVALVSMTTERDTALAKLAAIIVIAAP